jgi:cobalamin biosynthesis protein CbiG
MNRSCAIYVLTRQGLTLGNRLARSLDGDLYAPARMAEDARIRGFNSLPALVARIFHDYDAHIFLAAAGIAVRTIAPHLEDKTRDPAVVVLDHKGTHVISLLAGHLGGANELAKRVAELTGGTPVITTATDTENVPAIDTLAASHGLVIANPERIKVINAALAEGRPVALDDPENRLHVTENPELAPCFTVCGSKGADTPDTPRVRVTWHVADDDRALILHPRALVAGIGCRRGTNLNEIVMAITGTFAAHHLALASLAGLASIDIKARETGMLEAARTLNVPMTFYSAEELSKIAIPTPSSMVKKHIGVESVCEAAALKQTGQTSLLVPKQITGRTTLAVALAP